MPELDGRERLLQLIRTLPVGRIYTLADKYHVAEGFRLCLKPIITDISWASEGEILNIEIGAAGNLEIRIAAKGEDLGFHCNCRGWTQRSNCEHVIAVLAVLKKTLSPASLASLRLQSSYLHEVSGMLGAAETDLSSHSLQPSATEAKTGAVYPHICLEIECRDDTPVISLAVLGRQVSIWSTGVPERIRGYLVDTFHQPSLDKLKEFVRRFRGKYPIVVRSGSEWFTFTLDPASNHVGRLLFDCIDDRVVIARALTEVQPLPAESFICDWLFLNFSARRLEIIGDVSAWQLWHQIGDQVHELVEFLDEKVVIDRDRIILTSRLFNQLFLLSDPTSLISCCSFSVAGVPGPIPADILPSYRLNVLTDVAEVEGQTVLLAEGEAGGINFMLSVPAFWLFVGSRRTLLSVPMRARKRLKVLFDTCFTLLTASKTADRTKIIRAALNNGDFIKRQLRSDARKLMEMVVRECHRPETLLLVKDGRWMPVAYDKMVQARLLEIPYRIFGVEAFDDCQIPGEMVMKETVLSQHLPRLHKDLRADGFDLVLEDTPLAAAAWEFTVDATRSTIDWFEIRPEIRCNGELLDDADLQAMLAGGGLLRKDGKLFLLDEGKSGLLALLAPAKLKKRKKNEPVRIPRLQILDWLDLRRLGVKVKLAPADEELLESLLSLEKMPKIPSPEGLHGVLRHYQYDGYCWLAFLYEHGLGACLADDMGLGKTIQAIALLAGLHEGKISSRDGGASPHLIIVPPSLLFNWESEIQRFYPAFRVTTYAGQGRHSDFTDCDIVLTSYGIIQRDIDKLRQLRFHVVIFDEAQLVKNLKAATTGAVRQLTAVFKAALTGTPVENHLGEFYSIMDLCVPGLLGSYETFNRRIGNRNADRVDLLVRRTRPFVLRRPKQTIANELPPKIETDLYLELTPKQMALYARTVADVRKAVDEAFRSRNQGEARIIALTAILKLRQLCLSPSILLPGVKEHSPKVGFLVEQLEELRDEGHSALVFSQFVTYLNIIEAALLQHDIPFVRLDGSTPASQRKKVVTAFQNSSEPMVFLISLKAGGKGLNLTRATYVFHMDPWWNPAVENQASDRAHRIGQSSQVTITRLLMRHTIEEKMMELKKRKLRLYQALLEESTSEGGVKLSKEDFQFLLG